MMARFLHAAMFACLSASVVAQQPQAQEPEDMGCTAGPRAAQWQKVKKRFRDLFQGAGGPFSSVAPDALVAAVKDSIADIEGVRGFSGDADAVNECGFGKLFIQLMSLCTVDEPSGIVQYFQERPNAASPVMTMLLDIPWVSMAQSGWPFFAILSQLSYQKVRLLEGMLNLEAVDGLANEAIAAYFEVMSNSQKSGDMLAMATASQMFLRNAPVGSPYATLTAMATTTAVTMDIQERLKGITGLQEGLRQAMTTASELDIALTIRWPLWGFLHVAVDVFAD
jgi:hypothetical protein